MKIECKQSADTAVSCSKSARPAGATGSACLFTTQSDMLKKCIKVRSACLDDISLSWRPIVSSAIKAADKLHAARSMHGLTKLITVI